MLSVTSDIIERWAQFYEDLYNSNKDTIPNFPEIEDIPLVTSSELHHAISRLKSNKAPGPDGLVAEMFMHGGQISDFRLFSRSTRNIYKFYIQ